MKHAARLLGKPGQELDDADLIAGCLAGVAEAWDALIERYHPFLHAVITRQGLGGTEASDVFQDVCVILLEHLPALRDQQRLASWLAATARREAWRHKRRLARLQERGESGCAGGDTRHWETLESEAPGPEEDVLWLEEQHLVRLGLVRLGGPCRALLELLYGGEPALSYAEIAQRLRMPVGSIGPRRGRCLAGLRVILHELGFE